MTFPGPVINGQPTDVTLLEPQQFDDNAQFLDSLQVMINSAYREDSDKRCIWDAGIRLPTRTSFREQLTDTADTFVLLAAQSSLLWEGCVILGSLVVRRYPPPAPQHVITEYQAIRNKVWSREFVPGSTVPGFVDPETSYWELKLLAVDPVSQGRGLAGSMLKLAEGEIFRRFNNVKGSLNGGQGSKRLAILLTTLKESHCDFYLRRGYVIDSETWWEPGTLDSEIGFTTVRMSKSVPVL